MLLKSQGSLVSNTKENNVVFYIAVLRALAACLITNAHYTGIYPTDVIANGGLIGDIIFFAVSGFCLCNIKQELNVRGFVNWYSKRLWRVYPSVIICTAGYALIGVYSINIENCFGWFIYPTHYHFVASIIVLYIPFFFIMKINALKDNLVEVMIGIGIAWLLTYVFFYDKTYYHIDSVYEPMIHFIFMESMLLGAWFRINDGKLRNREMRFYPKAMLLLFILYFVSKLVFSRCPQYSSLQFLNQLIIFTFLFLIFRTFCGIDQKLKMVPVGVKRIIEFIARITLEIYVVQYVIIDVVRNMRLPFPINWFVTTTGILISAYSLHIICGLIYKAVDRTQNKQIIKP